MLQPALQEVHIRVNGSQQWNQFVVAGVCGLLSVAVRPPTIGTLLLSAIYPPVIDAAFSTRHRPSGAPDLYVFVSCDADIREFSEGPIPCTILLSKLESRNS
jgi:hypothetical protein